MPAGHLPFRQPVSQLNDDTLYHIFYLNTFRDLSSLEDDSDEEEDFESIPLTVTRRSSQVCTQWRRVLLRSSSIWGRCIDLDALGTSTEWRDEVIRRAGNTRLAIRRGDWKPYVGNEYLAQLLVETWPRVMELNIPAHLTDLNRLIPQLQLPAPSMESFVMRGWCNPGANGNVSLFEGHAPKLVNIRIPSSPEALNYDPVAIWKSPTFFTINMRHIHLENKNQIPPSVLLSACMCMPLLETLYVCIWLEDDLSPDFSADQQVVLVMNHLTTIYISCPTFDVYPTFLSRISTAPGCSLSMFHLVRNGPGTNFGRYADVMKQIFAKFSNSLYEHYPQKDGTNNVELKIGSGSDGHHFEAYDKKIGIQIAKDGATQDGELEIDALYLPVVNDAFLAVKIPSHSHLGLQFNPRDMHKDWISSLPTAVRTQLQTSLYRLLGPGSMPWVTSLQIPCYSLVLIHEDYQAYEVFPQLQHLILIATDMVYMDTVILPFVANRRKTMLTVNLHSLPKSPAHHVESFGPERLPGSLEFIWNTVEHFSLDRGHWIDLEIMDPSDDDSDEEAVDNSNSSRSSAFIASGSDSDDNPDADSN